MFSDLWLMSAATFRRSGKIEQAKGAIQEAEVKDEGNPAVWVQVSFYSILPFSPPLKISLAWLVLRCSWSHAPCDRRVSKGTLYLS